MPIDLQDSGGTPNRHLEPDHDSDRPQRAPRFPCSWTVCTKRSVARSTILSVGPLTTAATRSTSDIGGAAQVSHHPQPGQRPALLGLFQHSVVYNHATDRRAVGIGSGYGEQSHAIILQRKSIENQRIVRCQQNLAWLVRVQVPLAQALEERPRQSGVQSVVSVVYRTQRRTTAMSCDYREKQRVQGPLGSVISGKNITILTHEFITKPDYIF